MDETPEVVVTPEAELPTTTTTVSANTAVTVPTPVALEIYDTPADLEGVLTRGESVDVNRLSATVVHQMRMVEWLMSQELPRFEAEQATMHEEAERRADAADDKLLADLDAGEKKTGHGRRK